MSCVLIAQNPRLHLESQHRYTTLLDFDDGQGHGSLTPGGIACVTDHLQYLWSVKAIQEQQNMISDQRNQIERLMTINASLLLRKEKIEKQMAKLTTLAINTIAL